MTLPEELRKTIITILEKCNVKRAGIFGSYARGDATSESDIDIVVELANQDLFEMSDLKIDLENALNKKVDVVTYNGLNFSRREGFKESVLKEQVLIL